METRRTPAGRSEAIRLATPSDLDQIATFDQVLQTDAGRRTYLERVIAARACFVAVDGGRVSGYAVFEHSFFEQGWVALLYVASGQRRQGIGRRLMEYAASLCTTPKLFTSTNLSNHPMQALLARLGYRLSGVIHDLDEGDPELIYVKYLDSRPA